MAKVIRLECVVPPAAWKSFKPLVLEHKNCIQYTLIEDAIGRLGGMEKQGDLPLDVMRDRLIVAIFTAPIDPELPAKIQHLFEAKGGSCLMAEMEQLI